MGEQLGSQVWKEAGDTGTTGLGTPKGPCSGLPLAGTYSPEPEVNMHFLRVPQLPVLHYGYCN